MEKLRVNFTLELLIFVLHDGGHVQFHDCVKLQVKQRVQFRLLVCSQHD
jgi:hypothetical protein